MTRRQLLSRLDTVRIEEAIRAAERITTGEIRVSVAGLFWGDPRRVAESAFARLGMSATRDRNAVLVLVAPWHRRTVIVGDIGIAARVGSGFWDETIAITAEAFKAGRYTEGITSAIDTIARALAAHFPNSQVSNPDELDNAIDVT